MDLSIKAEHIRDMLGGHPPDEQRRILHDLLNDVPAPQEPSLDHPGDYVKVFRHLLFASMFPHVGNPQPPWNLGIATRPVAWQWVLGQMRDEFPRTDWPLRACLPEIQEVAREALVTWAECEYPLRLSPRILMQFGTLFSSLSSQCMLIRGWDFTPPPFCTDLAKEYIAAFYLNWSDDERRFQRELVDLNVTDTARIRGHHGMDLAPPSLTGAIVPPVPAELHAHHPRLWSYTNPVQSFSEREPDHETIPLASTPKRHREESPAPQSNIGDLKRLHVDSRITIEHPSSAPIPQHGTRVVAPENMEVEPPLHAQASPPSSKDTLTDRLEQMSMDIKRENEIFIRRHQNLPPDENLEPTTGRDEENPEALSLDLAIQQCMYGWPPFATLYGHPNDPTVLLHDVFAEMPFMHADATSIFIRNGNDPVLRALRVAEASETAQASFRMCNASLGLHTPLLGSDYRVWTLKPRNACSRTHEWTVGLRIGDPPSGIQIHKIKRVTQTPPGMRKVNFREALAFLQAPRQIGAPATLNTDSNLGFACYAYQSASVALPPGEAHKHILLRVEGTATRGGSGQAPQRAKVGYCPCCSIITHIAVPPSYEAGLYDAAKCTSTQLWQVSGPWAPRYYAAHHFRNAYGKLSTHWDWAASTLDLPAPHPLSLSNWQEPPLDPTSVHANPSPTPPLPHEKSSAPLPATMSPSMPSMRPPMQVNLTSCIPDERPAARDLSQFVVDDNSPPPSCSDGRNLNVVSQHNFPRGGHRLDPAPPPFLGSGKSAVKPASPLHDAPSLHEIPTKLGKSKSDLYLFYNKGKGKSEMSTYGKSKPQGKR